MKKLFTLLLALVATTALWAHDFEVNGIYYNILTNKTNEVKVTYRGSSYDSNSNEYTGSVTIPSTVTYNGTTYSVTSIGELAFANCSGLTSITIPNSVTSIGERAFAGCSSLTSITIPKSVPSIGDKAFYYCSSLTSVTIGNSVTGFGSSAFESCSDLTSITIPNSVTSIGNSAFRYCSGLTSVTIPNSVTSIGYRAFYDCSGLTSITIPNSVTSIGNYAFAYCSSLTSITIPNSVTSIGGYAFCGCKGLTSVYVWAEVPPTLGTDAFYNVSTRIPVYVPCGSVSAYQSVEGWKKFTNIQGPLAEYSITVGVNDNKMGTAKVDENTICGAQISATANYRYRFVQWSDGNTDNPRTLVLTQDTVLTAEFAFALEGQCGDNLYWSYDETTKTISITGSGDMYDYSVDTVPWLLFKEQIMEVTTSNTVTSIGTSAFEGCIRLAKVSLGSGMVNIAANAFAGCNRLYDIYCYASYPPFADESSFANYNVYVYIPCEYQRAYTLDVIWGKFKFIECIGADNVENTEDVTITPGITDVTITWPTEDNAYHYVIEIKKDDEVFCTLTFNTNGQLLNIAFAPGRSGNKHPAQYAEQAGNGYRFTVTGLEESTHYTYNIDVRDIADKTINSHAGEFTTQSITAVDNIQSPITNCQKLLHNGQLIILRDGVKYNAQGQIIKE